MSLTPQSVRAPGEGRPLRFVLGEMVGSLVCILCHPTAGCRGRVRQAAATLPLARSRAGSR